MAEEGQYWKPKKTNVEYASDEYKIYKIKDEMVFFGNTMSDVLVLEMEEFLDGFKQTFMAEKRIATHSGTWKVPFIYDLTGYTALPRWTCCGSYTHNGVCTKFLLQ